jgi:hypothetical protein
LAAHCRIAKPALVSPILHAEGVQRRAGVVQGVAQIRQRLGPPVPDLDRGETTCRRVTNPSGKIRVVFGEGGFDADTERDHAR